MKDAMRQRGENVSSFEVETEIMQLPAVLEASMGYAPNLVTGFAHVSGRAAGVFANQSLHLASSVDALACEKGALCVAGPSAEICAMSIEGGIDVAYTKQVALAPEPRARRAELIARFQQQLEALHAAAHFGFDDVNNPRETPSCLIRSAARHLSNLTRQAIST